MIRPGAIGAGHARRLLRLEPWDETALRRLLCALASGEIVLRPSPKAYTYS